MRRLVCVGLVAGLALIQPLSVQGQTSPDFGMTLGLNLATLEGSTGDLGLRQLFVGGAVAQVKIAGPVSAQSELLLNQKGALVRAEDRAMRHGIAYVDLPLLLHLEGPSMGRVQPFVTGGAFGSIKLFEQQRPGSSGLSLAIDTGTTFFRRMNAGWTGGLGTAFSMRRERRINLLVRYSHGVVDVARSVDPDAASDVIPLPGDAQTRTWSIMLRTGL